MKDFLRERSYDSAMLLLTQCAIAIFALVLAIACGMADNDTLRLACSIFAIAFYLFLVYTKVWDIGAKDSVSVEYGHKPYRPHTGLWIALIAAIPNFVLAIGVMLGNLLAEVEFFSSLGAGSSVIALLLEGMYTGLLAVEVLGNPLNSYWVSFFLIPLPAIVFSWAAYYFGLKNKKFTRLFELKNGKTKK